RPPAYWCSDATKSATRAGARSLGRSKVPTSATLDTRQNDLFKRRQLFLGHSVHAGHDVARILDVGAVDVDMVNARLVSGPQQTLGTVFGWAEEADRVDRGVGNGRCILGNGGIDLREPVAISLRRAGHAPDGGVGRGDTGLVEPESAPLATRLKVWLQ